MTRLALRYRANMLLNIAAARMLRSRRTVEAATNAFQHVYHEEADRGRTWHDMQWFGVETWKCAFDMWVFQELIVELRPDLIIEVGTHRGGSTLFYAHLCDLLNHGSVLTVDVTVQPGRPTHDRITYLHGSSLDLSILDTMRARVGAANKVMVFLDGDHSKDHVLGELRAYGPLVTVGSYLVAEDTNVNGRPILPEHGPGPGEAVDAFLAETDEFEPDRSREKFLMTWNPGGYLKRVKAPAASIAP